MCVHDHQQKDKFFERNEKDRMDNFDVNHSVNYPSNLSLPEVNDVKTTTAHAKDVQKSSGASEKSGDPQMMCGIKRAMEQHPKKTFQERACSPIKCHGTMNVRVIDCEETGFAACERHNCQHGDVGCGFVWTVLDRNRCKTASVHAPLDRHSPPFAEPVKFHWKRCFVETQKRLSMSFVHLRDSAVSREKRQPCCMDHVLRSENMC